MKAVKVPKAGKAAKATTPIAKQPTKTVKVVTPVAPQTKASPPRPKNPPLSPPPQAKTRGITAVPSKTALRDPDTAARSIVENTPGVADGADPGALPSKDQLENVAGMFQEHFKEKLNYDEVSEYKRPEKAASQIQDLKSVGAVAAPATTTNIAALIPASSDAFMESLAVAPKHVISLAEGNSTVQIENVNDFPVCYKVKTTNPYIESSRVKDILMPLATITVKLCLVKDKKGSYVDEHVTIEAVPCFHVPEGENAKDIERVVRLCFSEYARKKSRHVIKVVYQ